MSRLEKHMKYKNIKDLNQRCSKHPAHQNGMVSHQMIQDRLFEEIQELREYITQRPWVGLTEEDWGWVADRKGTSLDSFDQGAAWAAYKLERRNK